LGRESPGVLAHAQDNKTAGSTKNWWKRFNDFRYSPNYRGCPCLALRISSLASSSKPFADSAFASAM